MSSKHVKHTKRPHRDKESSKSKPDDNSSRVYSFLFVVNQLIIDCNLWHEEKDDWCNVVPPSTAYTYNREITSKVMKYQNGVISEARHYRWGRCPREATGGAEGYVWYKDSNGQPVSAFLYKQMSTFSCNPFLPILISEGDPSVQDNLQWTALQFFHQPHEHPFCGVSQAALEESHMDNGGDRIKFAAGRNASWIPSLVPKSYENVYPGSPPSAGLSGELPIVIGLMAFSEPLPVGSRTNSVDEIFLGRPGSSHHGRWHNNKWTHDHRARGCQYSYPFFASLTTRSFNFNPCTVLVANGTADPASSRDEPTGFLVSIFFDPENAPGSNEETLQFLERDTVLVRE